MTRKSGYVKKRRNFVNRKRKKVMLISAEGKNKTEVQYFRNLNSNMLSVRFAGGNETDPMHLVQHAIEFYEENQLDEFNGDMAFCLVDGDIMPEKDATIKKAEKLAERNHINFIVSNPCFEVWFLCHCTPVASTKQFATNSAVIKELKQYLPHYTKNTDIFSVIDVNREKAISNAKSLEHSAISAGYTYHTYTFQPATDVYKIFEKLL